jgi:hypothetical protein
MPGLPRDPQGTQFGLGMPNQVLYLYLPYPLALHYGFTCTCGKPYSRMHGNIELLAMISIDSKMVLVPRGHVLSIDIPKYQNYTYFAI